MEKIITADFDKVLEENEYLILDFSSPGCGPCKKVPALLDEVLTDLDMGERVKAFEADVTKEMELAQRFFIMSVPTIVIFKNGEEIRRFNSLPKKDKIIKVFK